MNRIVTSLNAGITVSALAYVAVQPSLANEPDYRYAVFDLGGLSGDASNAFGVSDEGHIIGSAFLSGNQEYHAVIFDEVGAYDLGTFGGALSSTRGVNSLGHVVGWAEDEDEIGHAFVWKGQSLERLDSLGGSEGIAHGLNDAGQIVGATQLPNEEIHATLWVSGQPCDLGAFYASSRAIDINEIGQIVGYSNLEVGAPVTAVLWQDEQMIDLGAPAPSRRSEAWGINDFGYIVGWAENENFRPRALLWANEKMYNLQKGTTGVDISWARSINNSNQVVGQLREYGSLLNRGFIWEQDTGMRTLDDLVPPNIDWRIEIVFDINNHGQIAGIGEEQFGNKWFRAILLTPVSPELTLSDPAPGVAGRKNTWTITGSNPGSRITFAYSTKGGGTVVPGCDKLDAVVQLKKPKVMKTVTADENGEARIDMFVPAAARNLGDILFQAVSLQDCQESQLNVFRFQ